MRVMVTRPKPFGEPLCDLIQQAGGEAIYFPTIDITSPTDDRLLQQSLAKLNDYDWVIFISPQAVLRSYPYMRGESFCIAAIGEGTAHALKERKLHVNACPATWNTEGLLALADFQALEGKKIAIIKGRGGRDLLSQQLKKRGADVTEIITYQRSLPDTNTSTYVERVHNQSVDVIICTSNEGLLNLKTLLKSEWDYLKTIPLLVISERMRIKASELGFQNIFLANNASNNAVLDALENVRIKLMDNQEEQNAIPPIRKSLPWHAITLFFSVLTLILMLVIFYLLNNHYLKIFSKESQSQAQYNQLQQKVVAIESQSSQLTEKLDAQSQAVNALQQTQTGFTRDEWLVVEAEFLVKLANNKLQFENNIDQAIQLLKTADQDISHLNDANVLALRKALADDIANLQGVNKVDVPGVYLQLSALNDQLDKLRLVTKIKENISPTTNKTEQLPWWKKGAQETWQTLRKIVVVRYHETGKPPLVLPEAQDFLLLNLHAALEKSMWGLLHQQPVVYETSLQQTVKWVKEYFIVDDALTQSILNNLAQLQKINVKPSPPALSASLQAFQEYFATHKQ